MPGAAAPTLPRRCTQSTGNPAAASAWILSSIPSLSRSRPTSARAVTRYVRRACGCFGSGARVSAGWSSRWRCWTCGEVGYEPPQPARSRTGRADAIPRSSAAYCLRPTRPRRDSSGGAAHDDLQQPIEPPEPTEVADHLLMTGYLPEVLEAFQGSNHPTRDQRP